MRTRFLTFVAANLRSEKFSVVDVGCSGGLQPVWRFFAHKFRAVGFDISIDACRQLAEREAQSDVRYVAGFVDIPPGHPFARRAAGRPVNMDRVTARLSARRAVEHSVSRLERAGLDEKLQQNAWQKTSLADESAPVYLIETLERLDFTDVDYLKIDIDGADFRVLNSLEGQFDRLGILAARLEVSLYGGADDTEHTFHNTDRFMRSQGFDLIGMDNRNYSMSALPARFLYPMFAQTVTGRLIQADAFYARDPAGRAGKALGAEKLAKLAAIYAALNQPDGAAEILTEFRDEVATVLDVDRGLDILAGQAQVGEASPLSYKDYMAAFAADPTRLYPRSPARPTLLQRLRAAWVSLTDWNYIARLEHDRNAVSDLECLRRAADRGDSFAQFLLGVAYAHGENDTRDPIEARKWFTLASDGAGAQDARSPFADSRDRMAKILSPTDVAWADRLAAEWRRRHAPARSRQ